MPDLLVNAYPEPLSMPTAPNLAELEELAGRVERVLTHTYTPFPTSTLPESWTIEKVRTARQAHDRGEFSATQRLINVVTTDPRVASGLGQRVAPTIGLPLRVTASSARGGRGLSETARAECAEQFLPKSSACPPSMRRRITADVVMAGFAIGQVIWSQNSDATRWNIRVERWPLEHTTWSESLNRFQLNTTEGLLTIEHGHGKWIIFEPYGPQSWMYGAIRALSMPWADRTYGVRYRSQHAAAHGSPVPVGQLPQGVAIGSPEGKLFQRFVQALLSMRVGGVRPFGSVIDYLEPKTSAWQVFDSIVRNGDQDISMALLGQDGTMNKGGVYTSPGFWGVRFDHVESDCRTVELGLQTGAINHWAAINFGVDFIPTVAHVVPDPEEDDRVEAYSKRVESFVAAVESLRRAGFEVTDETVSMLAEKFSVDAPKLAAAAVPTQLELAPTDLAIVVTVNEARASAGLGELMKAGAKDPAGDLTVAEFKAKNSETIAAAAQADQGSDPNAAPAEAAAPEPTPEDDEDEEVPVDVEQSGEFEAA